MRGKLITGVAAILVTFGLGSSLQGFTQDPPQSARGGVQSGRRSRSHRCRRPRPQGSFRPGPQGARLRGARRRSGARAIADLQTDTSAVSIAVLFDVSGSMEGRLPNAREAASHVLSWLEPRDEAAIFTFDTGLEQRTPFTAGLKKLPESVNTVVPFGATSLHDAIAQTAQRVGEREGRRRAIVVLTDGADNASRMKPEEVSALASAIDVPVYIFGVVAVDRQPDGGYLDDVGRAFGVHRAARGTGGMDRRPRVRVEHAGTAQHRGAADRRRAAASVPDRIRIERQTGLASARRARA